MKKLITGCLLILSTIAQADSYNGETILPQVVETEQEILVHVSENYQIDNVEEEIVSELSQRNLDKELVVIERN